MDYLGSMVNRCARISASALGGQIMCSADVVREINAALLNSVPAQPAQAIEEIRQMQTVFIPVGEIKLKGLEVPEMASLVYPAALLGRQRLLASGLNLSTSPSSPTPGSSCQ
jgi:adenylate cyclase